MIRGSTKIFLETLAGIVVAALLLAGFAVWRLGTGPLSIDRITPYVENALSDPASGRRVIIGASSLIWDQADHAIEVRADRVSVFDGDGQAVMVVPEMAVRFSLAALLRGVVAPRTISIVRPSLTVIRTAEGA
jgi:autotransporter translocation and assembly factor TamB